MAASITISTMSNDQTTDCAICLYAIPETELKTITCFHQFHRKCIEEWFTKQSREANQVTCPTCRHVEVTNPHPRASSNVNALRSMDVLLIITEVIYAIIGVLAIRNRDIHEILNATIGLTLVHISRQRVNFEILAETNYKGWYPLPNQEPSEPSLQIEEVD